MTHERHSMRFSVVAAAACSSERQLMDKAAKQISTAARAATAGNRIVVEDHVHLLVNLPPAIALSDAVRDLKVNSSKWVDDNHLTKDGFEWQKGYGAFTVSYSNIETGCVTSPKHAVKGEQVAREVLRELGCDLSTREEIARLVRSPGRPAVLRSGTLGRDLALFAGAEPAPGGRGYGAERRSSVRPYR